MKKVIGYYNSYDEEGRLFRDYKHQVEWLTTMHFFNTTFKPGSKIFDGCAGTGNYAFELARQGHLVVASDIVPHNVEVILDKQNKTPLLKDIFVGDLCKPNQYKDSYFDVVLCMGAFYHLDESKCYQALEECIRLLKKGGMLVISYINLMAALYIHMNPELGNMDQILKCYQTRNFNDPFSYMLPNEIEKMAQAYHLKILHHLTSDGMVYSQDAYFNHASQENFNQYMQFHLSTCENTNLLGAGLHGLIFLLYE